MYTVLSILSLLVSVVSAVVAVRSVIVRVRQDKGRPVPGQSSTVVAAFPRPGMADRATLKAIAESDGDGNRTLAVGRLEHDSQTRSHLEELNRDYPGFDIVDVVATPERRHVPSASLAVAAWEAAASDSAMVMASGSRPSAPAIRRLNMSYGSDVVCAALPVRPRVASGRFSPASDVARLTPVTFGLYGSAGVCPVLVVAGRDMVDRVVRDPLTFNRPSLGAALLASVDSAGFRLLDEPVAGSDETALIHIKSLARIHAGKYALLCLSLASAPLSSILVVSGFFAAGAGGWFALAALLLSMAARLASALTWPAAGSGPRVAITDALMSPAGDFIAFFRAVGAAINPVCPAGGFVIRQGGLMTPDEVSR